MSIFVAMNSFDDTIFAPATPLGGGAVAIVRISGPNALGIVDSLVSFRRGKASDSKGFELKYGEMDGLDEVLVSLFRSPHSYTGEDAAEISCHASEYIVREIMHRLEGFGARLARPGEFTQRAFLNAKMDLAQAEAVADLIASDSKAAHDLALSQLKGSYSKEFRALREQLVNLISLVELELDFSEEDVEFADRSEIRKILSGAIDKVSRLKDSFKVGNAVKNGVPVAIVGAPNSGKSTLLNAIIGEDRAIVSPIAGTTRDTIEESIEYDALRLRLTDTAGIRESRDMVEMLGIERTYDAISKASVVVAVVDSSLSSKEIAAQLNLIVSQMKEGQRLVIAFNKSDISGCTLDYKEIIPPSPASILSNSSSVRTVATSGFGVEELLHEITAGLAPTPYDAVVTSQRHYEALTSALTSLQNASAALDSGLSPDLLAEDLRDAISELGNILGEVTTDDILGTIFSKFCIGK